MTDAKLGRTGLVAGLRTEKTETESSGYVRARAGSTPAQQVADPVGSAQRDYAGNRRDLSGSYTKSLPSVHVTQNLTSQLKARLSWSTGFGRPALSNLRPNETANDATQTLTISNPSLLPQTASNWDATLDYYFEPVGNFSVSWFHKSIRDYIVSGINTGTVGTGANNGFNGEYGGYTRLTTANAGTATVQGWELSYQQQFTFLPGLLKGFRVGGNYTSIETAGDFGGTVSRSTNEVPGFIPRAGNVNASWHYRGFSVRYAINSTGDYITSFTAASVGRNLYRLKRTITNLGLAYQVRPSLTLTCDVSNLYNNPEVFYRGIRDQMASTNIPGTAITFGVNGRF
jgi:TonB-dependent receptor